MASLDKDIEELAQCVKFVQEYKSSQLSKPGKIVIMGHSTGSQDVFHYLHSPNPLPHSESHIVRPAVDGAITQAPVSDRENLLEALKNGTPEGTPNELGMCYDQLVGIAKNHTHQDNIEYVLPLSMTAKLGWPSDVPICARRFLSLASPDSPANPSQDDVFSSDLTDQRLQDTFGAIPTRKLLRTQLLVLYSGNDEYCPKWVSKENLLQRWRNVLKDKWADASGIVEGASHNVKGVGEAPQRDLIHRIVHYLGSV